MCHGIIVNGSKPSGQQPLRDLGLKVSAGEDDVSVANGGDPDAFRFGCAGWEERLFEFGGELLAGQLRG